MLKESDYIKNLTNPLSYCKEDNPFIPWHDHPEYELNLVTKGKGVRMIGDSTTRFKDNDLVLIGAYTPHESVFDPKYKNHPDGFQGEGIIIQFVYDFLGEGFFNAPENKKPELVSQEFHQGLLLFW